MACMLKRPCRLNFSMAAMDCSASMHGSATPRQRACEKRASPDSRGNCTPFPSSSKDSSLPSPKAVSPAADTFFRQSSYQKRDQPEEVCAKRMRRQNSRNGARRMSVSFSGCCKSHDGLRPSSRILDALVYGYFETQCIAGPEDIRTLLLEQFGGASYAKPTVLREVHTKLCTLFERVAELDDFCSMPVLIHGGGRGLQLQSVHRPHLRRLTRLFEQFVSGCDDLQ